jgi:NADH:ubiquinone oxidoreductase subunit F (NADH-binding)/NADH:ubiquinone oxidoreductase subunit E
VSAGPADRAALLRPFPRERTWLLPALQACQEAEGYLTTAALAAVAAHLRVPVTEVHGVATQYPELRLAPASRHTIRVCAGVTCTLQGGRELRAALDRRRASMAEADGGGTVATEGGTLTTGGGTVAVEDADCFFACSVAPLLEVDGTYRGRVTLADLGQIERWFTTGPRLQHGPPAALTAPVPVESASASATERLARLRERGARHARARPALRLLVQAGSCSLAVGAGDVLERLRAIVAARALDVEVAVAGCNGMCYAAPVVEVVAPGTPRFLVERVRPERLPELLDLLIEGERSLAEAGFPGMVWSDRSWRGLAAAAGHPFWAGQERVVLERCGRVDPTDLDDAVAHGAYEALASALDGAPEAVIETVGASSLLGRGGAYFPAAAKWQACRRASGEPRYLIMNGEEGEPGIFKDRHLLEGDPHRILEGVLIAAHAAGAGRAILYVHGEAHLAAERLARAVSQARAAGIVGPRMLGREPACEVELRRGSGGFILGDETALLESIEGRRAQPRPKPPFPVDQGLWGRPTVINNVETLAAVPSILARGGAWFAGLGTPRLSGTKVFALSGPLRRPGVVEVRSGVTLRALLEELGGDIEDGRPLIGAVVGGPSGFVAPAGLFEVPMEPRGQVSPGTGGVVAVPGGASILEIVRILLGFNARESCGKCTPCREGTPRLLAMLDGLAGAADPAAAVRQVRDLGEAIQSASLCGLGQFAPLAVLRGLEAFPGAFRAGAMKAPVAGDRGTRGRA